jgi:uncharacterized RmlC-like cupin family protein
MISIAEILSAVRAGMKADCVDPNKLEIMLRRMVRRSHAITDITPACQIVSAGPEFICKQGYLCASGISAQSAGARRINLQIVIIPPGVHANAHKRAGHETAIHILSGEVGMWYGEKLEQHLIARAGDFLYIPANMPHLPYNLSFTETCVEIVARTDPNDQESIVLLPELQKVKLAGEIEGRGRPNEANLPPAQTEPRSV